MSRVNNSFTDKQKAEIFVRDGATCCFSGANLWLLDAPLRVGWQSDWVDHKKPVSRGGTGEITNGFCASHTFNMKKRNNSADTTYLYQNGLPTPLYYEIFGIPHPSIFKRQQRLAKLEESDWYFNRAITWIFEALNYLWAQPNYERKEDHWFKAAYKKLVVYQKICDKKPSPRSLEDRKIITKPNKTQKTLLSIGECDSLKSMEKQALKLSTQYIRNSQAWWEYFHPEDCEDYSAKHDEWRRKAYDKACKIQDRLDEETFRCIQSDYRIRFASL